MFRNLVTNKKNIISYIITFFIALGSLNIGMAPFGMAVIGGLIEQKIPILIPLLAIIRNYSC